VIGGRPSFSCEASVHGMLTGCGKAPGDLRLLLDSVPDTLSLGVHFVTTEVPHLVNQ